MIAADRIASPRERGLRWEGARDRLHAIVEIHFDFIWRSLRGLGVPRDSADDAAQQVFLIAAQKLDSILLGSEKAFLFSTARNVAANMRRARARRREDLDEEKCEAEIDGALDPEETLIGRESRRALEDLLASLDEELRLVFVLFELEGQTMASIADLLGIPAGTVASRLRRARVRFRHGALLLRGALQKL